MPDSFIYCDRAFLISALFALAAFTACHHEDAPAEEIPQEQEEQEEPEDEISEEEIAQLKEWIYDQDGNLVFSRSGKEDLYFIGVDFEMDAISLAGIYAGILGFELAGKFWTSTEYSKDKAVVVSVDFGSSQGVLVEDTSQNGEHRKNGCMPTIKDGTLASARAFFAF